MLRVEGSRVVKVWLFVFVTLVFVLLWSVGAFDGAWANLSSLLDDLLHALNHEM